MRKTLLLVLLMVASFGMSASTVKFETGKKYRIECTSYTAGTFVLGAKHNVSPMIYYDKSSTIATDGWWYVEGDATNGYAFKNAATGQYLEYTTSRVTSTAVGTSTKGLDLATSNSSTATKWTLDGSGNTFAVVNAQATAQCLNVRVFDGTYLVGTYGYNSDRGVSANSLFIFYDESGAALTATDDNTSTTTDAAAGITSAGEYWERTGLSQPIVYTTDKNNPVLYTIKNVRSGSYVVSGVSENFYGGTTTSYALGQATSSPTQFYFMKSTDGGVNIYTSDGKYVSGTMPIDDGYNYYGNYLADIAVVSGTTSTSDNTWGFTFYSTTNPGYGIFIKKCTANSATNQDIVDGNIYWNDYSSNQYGNTLGYYTLDAGSTFIFYSSDARHGQYLQGKGIKFDGSAVTGTTISSYLTNIKFNGKPIIYDSYYGQYMLPVSQNYMGGKDYTATVTFDQKIVSTNYKLHVGADSIASGGKVTLKSVSGTAPIKLSIVSGKDSIAKNSMAITFMPVVEMTLASCNSSYYTAGSIRVNNPENDGLDTLYTSKYKYRGATASGLPKKAYAIKLTDASGNAIDRGLLGAGYREDNNWILDAMGIDRARMRNRVSTDLWNAFATKPYYFSKEKNAVPATRGKFVEILLNGKYQGTYCMTEKLDRKQLKLKKYNPKQTTSSDTIRGVLYKTSQWSYETFMGHSTDSYPVAKTLPMYDNTVPTWGDNSSIEDKYPDLDDNERINWEPLYNAVNFVANTDSVAFVSQVDTYFDRPVWRDYYLFIELLLATDNHGKNMFLFNYNTQDAAQGKMISMAPWDLDGTWGIRWDGSTTYTANATQDFDTFLWAKEHGQHTYFYRMKKISYLGFKDELAVRYAQLRKGEFLEANVVQRFAAYANLYKQSGAIAREQQRWSSTSGYMESLDSENDLSYLKTWIHSRFQTLDAEYGYDSSNDPTVPTSVVSLRQVYFTAAGGNGEIFVKSMQPTTVKVYTTTGQCVRTITIPAGEQVLSGFAPGMYIVNNHKVLVQ